MDYSKEGACLARHPLIVFGGRVMLAWALVGMPAISLNAYAQALPTQPTQDQLTSAAAQRAQDEATTNTLMNMRASRLLRSQYDSGAALRSPSLMEDQVPVRTPKIVVDPTEADRAAQQAGKVAPRTREEMVQGAQSAASIGLQNYERTDLHTNQMVTTRPDPGVDQSSGNRVNITEMLPGFSDKNVEALHRQGADMYHNPETMEDVSGQNRRNLRRDGCRKTSFHTESLQNIDLAPTSPEHRIMKVEFFDIEKVAIPNTNPVEYQTITKPTTYKKGVVTINRPTLGGVSNVIWDQVDETYAIRYTYTPYSNPKNRNYFTYNHWWGVSYGGPVQRVLDPGIASYGSPSDGWTPVTSYTVPYGVTAAYLTADLFRAEVTYTPAVEGQPCEPDPPQQCEVPVADGGVIRWCPGSYGANIVLMYDDAANPSPNKYGKEFNDMLMANASRKDYTTDADIRTGVIRGVNGANSDKAAELIGSCRRDGISRIEVQQGGAYSDPDMRMCSETLINPIPKGCTGIKRSFGLAYVGEHNYMTARAFSKVKVPIIDPVTQKQITDAEGYPQFTYRKDLINVEGPLRTDFKVMGGATCPSGENCTTEKLPDDPRGGSEGTFIEYRHTPMGGDPKLFVLNGVYAQGGAQSEFTDYGAAENSWLPTGTVVADGTLHEVRLMAKVYNITVNQFAGCEKYMNFAADGYCRGGKLTCKDTAPTRTVGDVTFGPDLPNRGIVQLLKKWGTDASAVLPPDYGDGDSPDPTPNGPALVMLEDQMCWEADGEPFESCTTMSIEDSPLRRFTRDGQDWATDCNLVQDQNAQPLESSQVCKRVPAKDECDTRFKGLFTGQCYNPTIAYDCGETRESKIPAIVEELGDSCSGAMRCVGTECHRPNLTGSNNGDFARAASGMEVINQMVNEMVCLETGDPPTSVDQACTPFIFGGKASYCKIPVGNQIGITPNCCDEARKGAKSAPSWMDYLSAMQGLNKLMRSEMVMSAMQGSNLYNSVSTTFGEIAEPVTNMYNSAATWVSDNIVGPFRAGFDNLIGGGSAGGGTGTGMASKLPSIENIVEQFTQYIYQGLNKILTSISPDLASMVFQTTGEGAAAKISLTPGMQSIVNGIGTVMMVYSIAKLIGHIIFACKQEEYEWGMNDKWRLCTSVGSCCSKKALFVCVEKRQLYCCYKSIVSRIISEQIVSKNLTGTRQYGFRTDKNGRSLGKCNINCGGFTAFELAAIDWSRVDLTEWTDVLVESGLINTADPRTNYGVSQNKVMSSMPIARIKDEENLFDYRVPAVKTVELLEENMDGALEYNRALRDEVEQTCYDADKRKMPFTYPGCNTKQQ